MPANLENSAVVTGLEKVSFHSNPKEGQCQKMFKLLENCTHFTCQPGNAQNPSRQASTVRELKNFRCTSWIQKRQRNQRSNCPHMLIIEKARGCQKNTCFIDYAKVFDCIYHNNLQKILKETGIPDHLTCLLRNLYVGQESTVRTLHGTKDWFKIGKVCILSPCLFNFYADYIM